MSLYTIFGINGIGKDTIAEELRTRNQDIKVTSMSRLLMYISGISKTYDVREEISEEEYKLLENIPQTTMENIENNEYRKILEEISKKNNKTIVLAHLVPVLRLGGKTKFLVDRKIPEWFIDMNKNIFQVTAPVEVISERRQKDKKRIREYDTKEIVEHQKLCTKEWERMKIKDKYSKNKMSIIENLDLNKAVSEIENIILDRRKSNETNFSRQQFLEKLRFETNVSDVENDKKLSERGGMENYGR